MYGVTLVENTFIDLNNKPQNSYKTEGFKRNMFNLEGTRISTDIVVKFIRTRTSVVLYYYTKVLNTLSLSFCLDSSKIPKPHTFSNTALHSEGTIIDIVSQLGSLLPQLAGFIEQFDSTVAKSGVNVITDTVGNMSIDVPNEMSVVEENRVSARIGIIDRLITTRGQEINTLLQKGLEIESRLRSENPQYVSQLSEQIQEFRRLNSLYKH